MIETIKLILIGALLGVANVIPGVSGGTIAVICNVYDRLISCITVNVKKIAAMWKFWLPLVFGVLAGILLFAKFAAWIFDKYPNYVRCFLIGLILGALPLILRKTVGAGKSRFPPLAACLSGIAAGVIAFFMGQQASGGAQIFPASAPFLLLAGILAAITMLLPGVSGSFLLVSFGLYYTVINAVGKMFDAVAVIKNGAKFFWEAAKPHFFVLLPFGIGVVIGLLAGAALVRFLLLRAPRVTYGIIAGLMAGSALALFPAGQIQGALQIFLCAVLAAAGAALSYAFSERDGGKKSVRRGLRP